MYFFQKLITLLLIANIFLIPFNLLAQEKLYQPLLTDANEVRDTSEMGQQLYQYLKQQKWKKAETLLHYYQQRPLHETLLVAYTKALLAQSKGDLLQAEIYYQQQLRQKADFIPAQTGLIQLYLYQREYKKAQQQLNQLNQISDLPKTLIQSIVYYQKQLSSYFQGRRFYQISLFYNDNLNHAPYSSENVIYQSTTRKVTQKGAKPIASTGMTHFLSFYQPYSIREKQMVSSYAYLRYVDYFAYHAASFLNLYAQISYDYQPSRYKWTISPYYEIKSSHDEYEYQSWGIDTAFFYPINKKHAINNSWNYKINKYRDNLINLNNRKLMVNIGYYASLNNNNRFINQISYSFISKKNTLLNNQQYGIKTGVEYFLSKGRDISFFLQYQLKCFNYYNPLLKQRRKDHTFILTANIKNKTPIIIGFYPAIEFRYTRRLSNVDWLYQYQQHEVIFKLEKQF